MKIFLAVSFLASMLAAHEVHAQRNESEYKYVESVNAFIGLQMGIPSGDMKPAINNKMGDMGFGLAAMVLFNPFTFGQNNSNSPVRIGAEAGYTYYGRSHNNVNINGYAGGYKTSAGIMQLNGVLQFRPTVPRSITPFVELLAGGNFFFSNVKEDFAVIENGLGIKPVHLKSYSNSSFNKGIALGCSIGKGQTKDTRFTIRVSYNCGGDVQYIDPASLRYNNGTGSIEYNTSTAPLKYFLVQLGFGG